MQKNHFIEIFFYWKRLIFHFRSLLPLFRGANARPIFFQTSIFGAIGAMGAMGAFLSIHLKKKKH